MNKEYELDVARTLVSAAPRLVSALLGGTRFSLSRRAERARAAVTELASDFPSGTRHLANAGLPPGDKLKHVPPSLFPYLTQ